MLVRERLQKKETFTDIDCRIADYILGREEELEGDSIRQIAKKLYVAPASIIRFCHKLGYEGFNDLKNDYLNEVRYLSSHFQLLDPNFPFDKEDKDLVTANKIAALYEEIIKDCQSLLTADNLQQAVEQLVASDDIYICTAGAHQGIAEVFKDKMMKIGKLVRICSQTDEAYYHACYCKKDSCFIFISYTGETLRVLKVGRKVKERGIRSVAVTSYGNNALSALCDCCLYMSTREKLIRNLGTFGSNVSAIYLLDVIYAAYFNRNYEKNLENKIKNSSESEGSGKKWGRHSGNSILQDGTE